MMIALCDRRMPEAASARKRSGSAAPPKARPPILRKFRRDRPSQNFEDEPAMVSMASNQFANGLVIVVHEILRASGKIVERDLVGVDAEIVIQRREDFTEVHGPFHGFAAQPIRGANDLADFHSTTEQRRAGNTRPMIPPAVLVDRRRAAELAPDNH